MTKHKGSLALLAETWFAALVTTILAAFALISALIDQHVDWWIAPVWAFTATCWSWTAVMKEQVIRDYRRLVAQRDRGSA